MLRTPNGKRVGIAQYLTLAQHNSQPCEYGHLHCAAWEGGPCADRLEREYGLGAWADFVPQED